MDVLQGQALLVKERLFKLFLIMITTASLSCTNQDFYDTIDNMLSFKADTISVEELKAFPYPLDWIDVRDPEEYMVSTIKGAVTVDNYKPKQKYAVVFCSVGVRSEKATLDLQKQHPEVKFFNLYGGIFDWFNQGNQIVDQNNKPTETIHTYNKKWEKWVLRGKKVH